MTTTESTLANPLTTLSLETLRRRTSAKWRHFPPDVLPLWVAEIDAPLAEPIVRALTDAVALGDTGYPDGTAYAEATADFAAARWGWRFAPVDAINVADVMTGIVELVQVLTEPGDAVVVQAPVYGPFHAFIRNVRRRIIEAPLSADHRIDLEQLDRAFTLARTDDRPAVFLMSSPHNPTGTVHTADELRAVASLAARRGVRVVVDEVHAPLVYGPARHVPYLAVDGGERGFAVLSASKAWNLAGIKVALAVAGAAARDDLARVPPEVAFGASHLGVIAQIAAWREGGPWLAGLLDGLDANRHALATLLAARLPLVRYRPPEATYLAWLDCRELGLGDDPAAAFLTHGRVALSPGPSFGTGGEGHARLNFATTPEILADAIERMAATVDAVRAG